MLTGRVSGMAYASRLCKSGPCSVCVQANRAQLSATVSSQTENIRTGLELVAKSKQILLKLQQSFKVVPPWGATCQGAVAYAHDYKQLLRPGAGDKHYLWSLQIVTATAYLRVGEQSFDRCIAPLGITCRCFLSSNAQEIDALCTECSSLIENHEKIQLLSMVHYNLGKTLADVENIAALPAEAAEAELMLRDDSQLIQACGLTQAQADNQGVDLARVADHCSRSSASPPAIRA